MAGKNIYGWYIFLKSPVLGPDCNYKVHTKSSEVHGTLDGKQLPTE